MLWVRQDRNQFLQQLPDKPEGWTLSPLLCLHPKGGGPDWGIPSQLLCTMSRRMRGTPRHTKCWESSYAYAEVSSWFSSGWGAVASQMVCSSRRGVLLRLLLIWCIRGRKKACCFLVCYHANIILLAFVFEEFFFLKYSWFYNAVLVSGVQQSDSVTPVFVYFFRLFSIMGYWIQTPGPPCSRFLLLFEDCFSLAMKPGLTVSFPPAFFSGHATKLMGS